MSDPLPCGSFGAILADPPWRFKNWSMDELASRGEKWARRNGRSPYDVMDTDAICALPIKEISARDCVLFLWATYPKLEDALRVIPAWGFTYKTVAYTWVKQNPSGVGWHFGLGYWTRGNPEICLLATRGKPKRVDNCVSNLVISPRRDHSRKPDEVRNRIERLVAGPYCELFARSHWPGWACWGDELEGNMGRKTKHDPHEQGLEWSAYKLREQLEQARTPGRELYQLLLPNSVLPGWEGVAEVLADLREKFPWLEVTPADE